MEQAIEQVSATTLRPTILLVEDHVGYRDIVRSSLTMTFPGVEVEVAGDVGEAINVLRGGGIEMVIADMTLADGSASDLISQSRLISGDPPPFIVFSNHSIEDMAPALAGQGVQAVVAKEQGLKTLTKVMREVSPDLAAKGLAKIKAGTPSSQAHEF